MQFNDIAMMCKNAVFQPEALWEEEKSKETTWQNYLKYPVFPIIAVVALVSGILTKVFGYHIPMVGVIRPSWTDVLFQMVSTIVFFTISLILLGWIAAYLAGLFGGKNDWHQAVKMLFLVSIPSLFGQILSPLPFVGWIIGLGLGIYSMVLLYRAIPVLLDVSLDNRVKHFILFLIASFVISILLSVLAGALFRPQGMMDEMVPNVQIPPHTQGQIAHKTGQKKPENYVEEYVDAMAKGDYNKDIIQDTADDKFTPPSDNHLKKEQVERFIVFAQKVKVVEKEQAEKLKQKYDKKEKSDDFSLTDIFNGLKDVSNLATLEMKVVKSNGGNWAEYQWVKDRVREAYYTPSLNETTKHNAALLKGHEDVISAIL